MKKSLGVMILCLALVLIMISGVMLYYFRYLSFSKHNIRPIELCDGYLERTYGKKFVLISKEFYEDHGYYVWKLKYKDEENMEFEEYYLHPSESMEGFFYLFFDKKRGECGVGDYYWQTVLQNKYQEDLAKHKVVFDVGCGTIKYCFEIVDESDICKIAETISKILFYTSNNVKEISPQVIGCRIEYHGNYLCGISSGWEGLDSVKKIYAFVYDEIDRNYQKELEEHPEEAGIEGNY